MNEFSCHFCHISRKGVCCGVQLISLVKQATGALFLFNLICSSVPDPDPRVFWPPGSVSKSRRQRYGSGSFYHHAKILR